MQIFEGPLHHEFCDGPFCTITLITPLAAVFECRVCGHRALAEAGSRWLKHMPDAPHNRLWVIGTSRARRIELGLEDAAGNPLSPGNPIGNIPQRHVVPGTESRS